MKKYLLSVFIVVVIATAVSCGTLYKAAVDERNVKTIYSDFDFQQIRGCVAHIGRIFCAASRQ